VEVDFELFNMDLSDFHAIRTFLTNAFGQRYTSVIDAGEIAKLITEDLSEDLGTTIKTEGEGADPYGYATLIPLGFQANRKGVDMLKAFFLKTCPTDKRSRLKTDLNTRGTSAVFMDRFVNLPAELASPLYRQLLDDVKNAVGDDAQFSTERVLISTPTYFEIESDLNDNGIEMVEYEGEEGPKPGKKRAKKGMLAKKPTKGECKYYYGESELLPGLCDYHWSYKVDQAERVSDSKRAFGDIGIESSRQVFALTWSQFTKFVGSIEQYIAE